MKDNLQKGAISVMTILGVAGSVACGVAVSILTAVNYVNSAIAPGTGTSKGQFCIYNGLNWTILKFSQNSITPAYSTSTSCDEN